MMRNAAIIGDFVGIDDRMPFGDQNYENNFLPFSFVQFT